MAEPYGTISQYRGAFAIKKHNALIQPWASRMALDVSAIFWATWKGIEERLPTGDEIPETDTAKDARAVKNKYNAIARVEVRRHSKELQRTIAYYAYKCFLAGAVEQSRALGCADWYFSPLSKPVSVSKDSIVNEAEAWEEWVDVPNSAAKQYASERAAEMITGIDDTTRKEIAAIIQKGIEGGMSYDQMAKEIKAKFEQFAVPKPQQHIPNRAVLVAVTEAANAYCAGNYNTGEFLQDQGQPMMKCWRTLEDNRVSDGCKHNQQAGWIFLKDSFPSGHAHPPRFPGCRCDFFQDLLDPQALGKQYGEEWASLDTTSGTGSSQSKTSSKTGKSTTKGTKKTKKSKPVVSVPPTSEWGRIHMETDYYNMSFADQTKFDKGMWQDIKHPGLKNILRSGNEWFDKLPYYAQKAIERYTRSAYSDVNKYLRGDKSRGTESVLQTIRDLKKAISNSVNTEPLVVKRGFNGDFWDDWSDGETRKMPEFLSASVKGGFAADNRALIYVPPNKGKGAFIDGNSTYPEEAEYLLNAGNEYRLVSKKENGDGGYDFFLELIV